MNNTLANVVILLSLIILNCVSLSVQNRRVKRIVGGKFAAAPPPDDPVVFTNAYNRNARIEGYRYWQIVYCIQYTFVIFLLKNFHFSLDFFSSWKQKQNKWFVFIFGYSICASTDWAIPFSKTTV